MADEANEVESKGGNFVVYEENELESKGGNFVDDEADESESKVPTFMTNEEGKGKESESKVPSFMTDEEGKESESKVPTFMTDEEGKGMESLGGNFGQVNVMEGVASIALLPTGSISGHFIQRHDSTSICYGLLGTELACEKECSRGEDYRLIKLSIIDYNGKKEKVVVVECRGHDAARLQSVEHAHGWEEDVVDLVAEQHGKNQILVSFNCETLKSDKAAEDHIRRFLPKLAGLDAVVNIGRMTISGLDFEAEE